MNIETGYENFDMSPNRGTDSIWTAWTIVAVGAVLVAVTTAGALYFLA